MDNGGSDERAAISHRAWLRVFLVVCFFLPAVVARSYDPTRTPDVVRAVLQDPYVEGVPSLLQVAKALLVIVVGLALIARRWSARVLLGYYALILILVAPLQNIADTDEFGRAWLVGNTVLQLIVALWCAVDVIGGRSRIEAGNLRRDRLWLLIPMLLAIAMPYTIRDGHIAASFASVATNGAGVTYCMITPVVLGVLALFPDRIDYRTLFVASFVGMLFGVVNLVVWFVLTPADWWMGILHLPLVITAIFGLVDSRRRRSSGVR
ncbi:hypothetical protein GOARA_082_00830 [Gordonia araii NBRC 100433]|uniref:Uncharacterized protein n=1 Tax=Gordonia araii NBRC 100433 TaxID=1073574 RepID=G7H769_9ACTN|nr:hypothetical protein [Gordonia araii]NNG97690.1 hypothetical protein [Gordonia araii NBRC 100433]GAB11694.1 hypothetical protein GOARA_082_00830 [Gordonia araii NBRC 100433]